AICSVLTLNIFDPAPRMIVPLPALLPPVPTFIWAVVIVLLTLARRSTAFERLPLPMVMLPDVPLLKVKLSIALTSKVAEPTVALVAGPRISADPAEPIDMLVPVAPAAGTTVMLLTWPSIAALIVALPVTVSERLLPRVIVLAVAVLD